MFNNFLTSRTDFSAAQVDSTPALLALKRFIRGPLRQFGLGLVSFALAFGLTTYLPAVAGHTPEEQHSRSAVSTASSASEVPNTERSKPFGEFDFLESINQSTVTHSVLNHPAITAPPRRVLTSKMTGHRLTGARLSLPLVDRPEIASISEDK